MEPLAPAHVPDLHLAGGNDDAAWRWLPVLSPRSETEMRLIVEQRLAQQAAGAAVLFTVVPRSTGRAAGWAAYLDASVPDERVEIGWCWLGRSVRDTCAFVETHLLLCRYAFEALELTRVQWQVDHEDLRTRAAVSRIGAEHEGLLRRYGRRRDGSWHDTLLFSLLAWEWPEVSARVEAGAVLGGLPAPGAWTAG